MNNILNKKIKELFIAYSNKLPGRIEALNNDWEALKKHFNPDKFVDFHRAVHSLCGSSGTYGYMELSKSARKFEIALKELLNKESLSSIEIDNINALLLQLQVTLTESKPIVQLNLEVDKEVILPDKILYIFNHDDNFIREIQPILKEAGYTLEKITDIHQLAGKIKSRPPAGIILDLQYIGTQEMKQLIDIQSLHPSVIPIFCIANNGEIFTRLKAIRAGSCAFLQKPVDSFYLAKLIDRFCNFDGTDQYRILIVDDSSSLAQYYALLLTEAGMLTRAITNPMDLMLTMESFQPDLILMDIYMPACNGLELAAILRQESQYTHIPIIFLSTEDDKFKQLSALSLGGDDFLTKPIVPQHLIETVKLRAKRATILNAFMTHDSLTGLLNHTNILQRLETELARAERNHEVVSFVMVDIDHFKLVNDKYGHPMGDKVLKKLSSLFLTTLRKTDIVGRYGGEEFAIVFPNTDITTATEIINHLRRRFGQYIFSSEEGDFTVTLSAGIASYPSIKAVKQLVDRADQALYQAKHRGRNQIISL